MDLVSLLPHPATPCTRVARLDAGVERIGERVLAFRYVVQGDVHRLRLAAAELPRRRDGLWRHTCFEAFVAATGSSAYCELNFAPSSAWAAYAFDAYREGMREAAVAAPPRISIAREARLMTLDAVVALELLAGSRGSPALRLGLAAVIEDDAGGLSYWALTHPLEKPDFHHAAGFAFALPRAAAEPSR